MVAHTCTRAEIGAVVQGQSELQSETLSQKAKQQKIFSIYFLFVYVFIFLVLGIQPKTLCILGKWSTTEPHTNSLHVLYWVFSSKKPSELFPFFSSFFMRHLLFGMSFFF
jgi:hypothetical protein